MENKAGSESYIEEGEEGFAPSSSYETQTFEVGADNDGHRLDYAVSRLLGVSRTFAASLIKEGDASLSPPRRIKPSVKVFAGDTLALKIPPVKTLDLEPQEVPFETVYEDGDVIVVNKPAGIVVHPAPGHRTGTLVHGLLFRYPELGDINGFNRPGIVHRLDAATSGLMVVARNGLATESLFNAFKARSVRKEYLALCYGTPPARKGVIEYPIGRSPYDRKLFACVADGKEARTDYEILWSANGKSFIKCALHSGRTHQIRVHMKEIKCPLVGDALYAPSRKSPFLPPRVFLHSWRLGFKQPRTGKELLFTQPLPKELIDCLKSVRASAIGR